MYARSSNKGIRCNRYYEYIFYLFNCSAVIGFFDGHSKRSFCKRSFLLLNDIINVFLSVPIIMQMFGSKNSAIGVGSSISFLLNVMHRFFLCRHAARFGSVAQRLSKLAVKRDIRFNKHIYLLLFSCVIFGLIFMASATSVVIHTSNKIEEQKRFSMDFNMGSPKVFLVVFIPLSVCFLLLFVIPVNTFMIYFVSVCHDIQQLFLAHKAKMNSRSEPDYRYLTKNYNYLRNLVIEIDSQTSCVVFWAALANVFNLYFGIAVILDSEESFIGEKIYLYTLIIFSTFMFFLMCLWADGVSSSAASVAREAQMLDGDLASSAMHFRYILAVSQEVHMTVWNLLPLRKSFVLASIGTMITYSVLIKDIVKQ
ncbi:hypothetical protein HNY73_006770 [Argiope bruennichi]|uniref:Gustatory receptor n=1 Tax=Argiope bruennichi TaxID=94029 RepID=A0A8T0FBV8_ARGBR|nr:hypothetical protein HNY73_006770 [Argiope bruennichi]